MLTSAAQCTTKALESAQSINAGICVRGSGMLTPLQHNALQKETLESARTSTGICVRGSGMLTPLTHNAKLESAQNKDWHLCQRIRNDSLNTVLQLAGTCTPDISVRGQVLTPLQHIALHKSAGMAQNKHWHLSEDQEC
jgi:hypothetical protein